MHAPKKMITHDCPAGPNCFLTPNTSLASANHSRHTRQCLEGRHGYQAWDTTNWPEMLSMSCSSALDTTRKHQPIADTATKPVCNCVILLGVELGTDVLVTQASFLTSTGDVPGRNLLSPIKTSGHASNKAYENMSYVCFIRVRSTEVSKRPFSGQRELM